MNEAGIFAGDIVIVDKSIPAKHGHVVLVVVDGEFSIRRVYKRDREFCLFSDNRKTELLEGEEVALWGVVTASLRRFI